MATTAVNAVAVAETAGTGGIVATAGVAVAAVIAVEDSRIGAMTGRSGRRSSPRRVLGSR